MDLEASAVGEGEQFGVVEESVEVFNGFGLQFAVQDKHVVLAAVLEASPRHLLHDALLPPPEDAFSQEVLELQAVGVEHLHHSILRCKQADVLVDERGLGGGRAKHNDSSLRGFFHHRYLVIRLLLLDLPPEHVIDDLRKGHLVVCLQPAVEGLAQGLDDGLLFILEGLADEAEVEDEELHGPEAEVVLRPQAQLDGQVFEHDADLVRVDGGRRNTQAIEHDFEDLLVIGHVNRDDPEVGLQGFCEFSPL